MGQQAKMLSDKPDDLGLVPGIYLVGENQLTQVSRAVALFCFLKWRLDFMTHV